jgi:hypothetical protein
MKKILIAALAALVAVALFSACSTYRVTHFRDHPTKPVTELETNKFSYYVFYGKVVHQFYLCKDEGNVLNCGIACDGNTDLVCPEAGIVGNTAVTNVR